MLPREFPRGRAKAGRVDQAADFLAVPEAADLQDEQDAVPALRLPMEHRAGLRTELRRVPHLGPHKVLGEADRIRPRATAVVDPRNLVRLAMHSSRST